VQIETIGVPLPCNAHRSKPSVTLTLRSDFDSSFFMLLNIVVAAWIIGSITLLIVKGDEKTGEYRYSLETLKHYGEMHEFDDSFMKKLKSQLKLGFQNREISDEQGTLPQKPRYSNDD
jgi:hypothetical protein